VFIENFQFLGGRDASGAGGGGGGRPMAQSEPGPGSAGGVASAEGQAGGFSPDDDVPF